MPIYLEFAPDGFIDKKTEEEEEEPEDQDNAGAETFLCSEYL